MRSPAGPRPLALCALLLSAAASGCAASGGDGGGDGDCAPDVATFEQAVWTPVLSTRCAGCHAAGGVAATTAFVVDAADMAATLDVAIDMATRDEAGTPLLLAKASGAVTHGGGMVLAPGSGEYAALASFAAQVNGACE
jgi:hypothetical protein